eukprot:2692069-Prymnesium_polylepis.1
MTPTDCSEWPLSCAKASHSQCWHRSCTTRKLAAAAESTARLSYLHSGERIVASTSRLRPALKWEGRQWEQVAAVIVEDVEEVEMPGGEAEEEEGEEAVGSDDEQMEESEWLEQELEAQEESWFSGMEEEEEEEEEEMVEEEVEEEEDIDDDDDEAEAEEEALTLELQVFKEDEDEFKLEDRQAVVKLLQARQGNASACARKHRFFALCYRCCPQARFCDKRRSAEVRRYHKALIACLAGGKKLMEMDPLSNHAASAPKSTINSGDSPPACCHDCGRHLAASALQPAAPHCYSDVQWAQDRERSRTSTWRSPGTRGASSAPRASRRCTAPAAMRSRSPLRSSCLQAAGYSGRAP